jgi:phosphopantothenoylcysteine decarboxylase/phosphopantothenate--cysteine ligase
MRVALGVGGGIAAYKAAELARELQRLGAEVQAILTAAAQQFIAPLTFAALTNRKVITGLFDSSSPEATLSSAVEHVRVAGDSDVLAVAPATADLLAHFAHGSAPDFLTTLYLAYSGRVVLAPAMNTQMWLHPATQANLKVLSERGHVIVDPDSGLLACGTTGPGRLADVATIARKILDTKLRPKDLLGESVLVTAGPTQEPIDPVRYLSNRSSGKMGYAIAEAARDRGASVTLISGPVNLAVPSGIRVIQVRTAQEMYEAVLGNLEPATMIIKSAAVADYFVAQVPGSKLKKTAMRLSIDLDPTPDILSAVGQIKEERLLIGFAAETENLVSEARRKLETKRCDMVVANLVSAEAVGVGFEADDNEVTIVTRAGDLFRLERASKRVVADHIFDHALRLRLKLHGTES